MSNPDISDTSSPAPRALPDAEWSRWACEHLVQQCEWENARRRGLDAKAVQIVAAVSAVLLWSIGEVDKLPQSGWLQSSMALAIFGQTMAASLAVLWAFQCIRVTDIPSPNPAELKRESTDGKPFDDRKSFDHYRKHLYAAFTKVLEAGDHKKKRVQKAEIAAAVAIPAGILFTVLAKVVSTL
jgi:hypothetical protein